MRGVVLRAAHPSVRGLAALACLAVAYNVIRGAQGDDAALAFANARDIVTVEGWFFDNIEVPLNTLTASWALLAVPACYFYAVAHYVATPVVLFLSWRIGGWRYYRGYWSLILASAVALVSYASYPVAPPRLMPSLGIVDVMREFADFGWWGSAASAPRGIGDATNQFAAMPSLHCGWALWCGIQLWNMPWRWCRPVAVAYPTIQAFVVIGTGNHYLLDVVGGLGVVVLAHLVVQQLSTSVRAGRLGLEHASR